MNLVWGIIWIVIPLLECRPLQKFWNRDLPGTCVSNENAMIANSVGTVLLDLYTLLLPMPMLCTKLDVQQPESFSNAHGAL